MSQDPAVGTREPDEVFSPVPFTPRQGNHGRRWEDDGNTWRPTTLVRHIVKQATGSTAADVGRPGG